MEKLILSPQFKLQARDFVKGLIMAVITAVIAFVYELVQQGTFEDVNYATVGKVALTAGVGYIFKNFVMEPAKVITIYSSNEKAKEVAKNIEENN